MENKKSKDKIEEFNVNQRQALQEIIDNLNGLENIKFFVGYWLDSNEFIVSQDFYINEHKFLNYYWCEYKKDNINYRITMFYKDFDHGSGNIHILPGGIQIWEKISSCNGVDKGFCGNELKRPNIKDGKIEYQCLGGKPYTEFGWKPLFEYLQLWNNDVLEVLIDNLKKDSFKVVKCGTDVKSFYSSVLNPPKGTVSSQSRGRYILLQFNEKFLYYKTVYINGYGYFTKFDGEEIEFKKYKDDKNNINEKGPNHYDLQECKWVIEENLF